MTDLCPSATAAATPAMRLPAQQQHGAAEALQSLEKDRDSSHEKKKNQDVQYRRFCDMLRHSSAVPLVAEIKRLTMSFPGGMPMNKAADVIHRFLSTMEDRMNSDIVVFAAEADEEGRAAAAEGLEKFVFGRLYSKLVGADKAVTTADKALLQQMEGLQWVTLAHLGIDIDVDLSLFPLALEELRQMDDFKAPKDKLVCILNACRVINDVLKCTHASSTGVRPLSADDFLPLLILAVIQARAPHLHFNVEFVANLRPPKRLLGEEAYFLTALQSAIAFVQQAGPDALGVSREEYDRLFAESADKFISIYVPDEASPTTEDPAGPNAGSSNVSSPQEQGQKGKESREAAKRAARPWELWAFLS